MVDKYSVFMFMMIGLVIVVVSVSQYQQFALVTNNGLKLGLLNEALTNQTNHILDQLVTHRQKTNQTFDKMLESLHYITDTNEIVRQILNETNNNNNNNSSSSSSSSNNQSLVKSFN